MVLGFVLASLERRHQESALRTSCSCSEKCSCSVGGKSQANMRKTHLAHRRIRLNPRGITVLS